MTTEAALGRGGRVLETEHIFLARSDAALRGTVSEQPCSDLPQRSVVLPLLRTGFPLF